MDQELEKLMRQLGEAINETISASPQVAEVIARVKTTGYDIFVVLEATVGFNHHDEHAPAAALVHPSESDPCFSAQDARFLKSLRISVDSAPGRNREKST